MAEKTILTLTILPEHLKRIISGEKKEEYRSASIHYAQLFGNRRKEGEFKGKFHIASFEYGISDEEKRAVLIKKGGQCDYKPIKQILFRAGYSLDKPFAVVNVKSIEINKFINKMPANLNPPKGSECFIIYISSVEETGNLDKLK
jgi:hypothetical protein